MLRFMLKETDEYERLVEFMKNFGLEFNVDEKVDNQIIKCWKVVQEPDYLVGGIILGKRNGEYVIDGMAVDTPMRKTGIGRIMAEKLIKEVRKLGGERIWLVAKVPEFYEKLGFVRVPWEEAPDFFSCGRCEQCGVDCFPAAMKMEL